jgi:phage baseplate assembly protein W
MKFVLYSDLNQTSPSQKHLVTNLDSINQSIKNILTTRAGERLFNPEFGCDLTDDLFELSDSFTESEILRRVFEAVDRFEPRVRIDYGSSGLELGDDYSVNLTLIFSVEGIEDQNFEIKGSFKS